MQISFNPSVKYNQKNQQSFNALPVDLISGDTFQARKFLMNAIKGNYPVTEENYKDLLVAIEKAKDIGAKGYLEQAVEKVWSAFKN